MVLLTNNLMTMIIQICLCLVFFYPHFFFESILPGGQPMLITFFWLGVYNIVAFSMYYFAGNKLLKKTNNKANDLFSVIILAVTLAFYAYIGDYKVRLISQLPFYLLGTFISYYFKIKETPVFVLLAALPSLVMWIGIINK